jgi:hypothetical protein
VTGTTETQATEPRSMAQHPATLKLAAVLLFAIALAVTLVRGIRTSAEPFDYPHAFVSADVATAARTFAEAGILHLHAVPVNNNPPIAAEDAYTHWPPLLPILLSLCFRIFGVSERVAHLLMLAILVATALLIFRLGQRWLGIPAGALAGFFYLTLPVTLQFGHLVSQQALMTLFLVAATLAFLEDHALAGSILIFVGALTSWEIVLVVPGLLVASRWRPELRRSAIASAIGAGAGVACVAGLYLINSPGLAVDALQTAKFYMGLSPSYSRMLPAQQTALTFSEQVRRMLLNNVWMLGPLGLGAAFLLFTTRVHNRVLLLASLSTPWLVWCVAMRNHMARHEFEFVIAAPFIAVALAWLATAPSKSPTLRIATVAALAAIQILALPKPHISDGYDPAALIRYAQAIRQFTPPDAIVMAPVVSAVPLYYSQRHLVRGVNSPSAAALQLPSLRRQFPSSPIYLAVPPTLAGSFAATNFPSSQVASSTSDGVIIRLSGPHTETAP